MANIQTPVEVRHDGEEQAALQRLATIVAQGMPPAAIFSAVSREVEALFEADAAAVVKFEHDPPAVILLGTGDNIRSSAIGVRSEFVDGYAATAVYKTGRSARVDAHEGEVIDGPVFAYTRNVETGDSLRFTSAVASPLLVDGKLWGAISVSGSRSLPPDTEARLERFTAIVAPAIANADSREELATLAAEQAALRRVATLAASGATPEEVFAAVAREVAELFGVPLISMGRFEADGTSIVIGNRGDENPFCVGARFDPHPGVGELVRQTGRPARIDAYSEVPGAAAAKLVALGVRSAIGAPIFVDGRTWGAVAALSTAPNPLPRRAEDRLASFTELLSTAIASSDSREALAALADEQAALRRVATLVARDAPSADVFAAVATEVARLFDTEITVVGRYENGFAVAIGNWSASGGGVPAGTRSAVGGHNVLTLVAQTGKPARIDGYDDASGEAADIARRYGWRSSIAAPIIVEDHLWGVMLVATERPEGFPPAAEDRLAAFTDLVATAIANTQSRAEVQQLADEQAALRRVATVVAKEGLPEAVFAKVAEETGRVLGGAECTLLRSNRDGSATNVGNWGEKIAAVFPHGSRFYPDGDGVASTVLRTGLPYRIDDYSAVADPVARGARERGTECAVGCPILVNGELWGAIVVGTTVAEPFPPDTELRLSQFADLVATAIANAESRSQLAASRRRIVTASDETRRRIERDLHDGTQQRLASLALSVRTAESNLPAERQDLRDELSQIALGLAGAIEDLQEIARGIHPAILSKGGLGPAIRALATHSPITVDLDVRTEARLAEPVEVAAYFVVSEALANTAKHSHATHINIALHERDGTLRLSIRDNGAGGADPGRGTGLVGLTDRVEALGGSLTVHSRPGEGTEIRAELPIELATPP